MAYSATEKKVLGLEGWSNTLVQIWAPLGGVHQVLLSPNFTWDFIQYQTLSLIFCVCALTSLHSEGFLKQAHYYHLCFINQVFSKAILS